MSTERLVRRRNWRAALFGRTEKNCGAFQGGPRSIASRRSGRRPSRALSLAISQLSRSRRFSAVGQWHKLAIATALPLVAAPFVAMAAPRVAHLVPWRRKPLAVRALAPRIVPAPGLRQESRPAQAERAEPRCRGRPSRIAARPLPRLVFPCEIPKRGP